MNRLAQIVVAVLIGFLSMMMTCGWTAAEESDPLIMNEAFGGAFGFAIYNSQVIVGITADSLYYQVYEPDVASSIIAEQDRCLVILREYVQKIIDAHLADNEEELLQRMIDATYYLQDTISALNAYIADSSVDNANDFDQKRQKSYNAIASLLGIDDAVQ